MVVFILWNCDYEWVGFSIAFVTVLNMKFWVLLSEPVLLMMCLGLSECFIRVSVPAHDDSFGHIWSDQRSILFYFLHFASPFKVESLRIYINLHVQFFYCRWIPIWTPQNAVCHKSLVGKYILFVLYLSILQNMHAVKALGVIYHLVVRGLGIL